MKKGTGIVALLVIAMLCAVQASAQVDGATEDANATKAEEGPRTFVAKVTIELDGKAQNKGMVKLHVTLNGGDTFPIEVGVVEKMKVTDLARDIGKELELAVGDHLKIKASGKKVEIEVPKEKKGSTFYVNITNWNILGVSVLLDR